MDERLQRGIGVIVVFILFFVFSAHVDQLGIFLVGHLVRLHILPVACLTAITAPTAGNMLLCSVLCFGIIALFMREFLRGMASVGRWFGIEPGFELGPGPRPRRVGGRRNYRRDEDKIVL